MENKPGNITVIHALPLLWLSVAFLIGILAGSFFNAELWLWFLLAGVAVIIAIGLRQRLGWLPLFVLAAACTALLGAARAQAAKPQIGPGDLAYYNDTGNWAEVHGILDKPAVQGDGYVELLVRSQELIFSNGNGQPVNGLLLVRADFGTSLDYGDEIFVSGELTTPPVYEDFSYRDYLARQSVYSLIPFANVEKLEAGQGNPLWAALYTLRQRGVETLYRIYPAREASLLAGILLGDESGISEKVKLAFNDTSTRHIIAISGFNISIIAGLFLALFGRWLGARRGAWVAGIGIALYTILVGADATVVRAAIMGILAMVALQTGRQSFALNTLGFSAALMALVNPLVLWDIGFQLSFAATLGLVLYSEPLRMRVDLWLDAHLQADSAKRLSRLINDYLLLTLAAQITTLPILLYYFHRLSLLSLPANLLILPAQPALMIFGGLSVLAGIIFLPLGQLIGFISWALAAYTMRIVEFFAGLPWASQILDSFPFSLVLIYFIALTAISIPAIRARIQNLKGQPIVGLVALGAISLWAWNAAYATPDGKLHLSMLDLEGEALLIQTPDGRSLLVNTGSSANQLMDELSKMIPLGQKVDWIIVAGRRPDQINGLLGAMERLAPAQIGWAISDAEDQLAEISSLAAKAEIQVTELYPGDQFDLGRGAQLKVVRVGPRGTVLLLIWNNFEALLPLGLDFDQIDALMSGVMGSVDLLILADSGYAPLNPPEWIDYLSPSVIWLDAEEEPVDEGVTDSLGSVPVLRTDQNGWLQATTDGNQLWLEEARR